MITYKNKTFSSKTSTFLFDEVSSTLVFQWVKCGLLSARDFCEYMHNVREAAFLSGTKSDKGLL